MARTLWAVSDLHVTFKENQAVVDNLTARDPGDWLIVAGDVAERIPDVVSVPGNHELFNRFAERICAKARYRALVGELCAIGVLTPEDPYPVFGNVTICPMFTLYDYSFRALGLTAEQAISQARVNLDD